MIAIVDYGVGNLYSLACSLDYVGVEAIVTRDKAILSTADKIILPGVGAFGDAMEKLRNHHLDTYLCDLTKKGKPLLGICLGMQLLFEKSYEYGQHVGLGLLKGTIVPLSTVLPATVKVPHMGWNELDFTCTPSILSSIRPKDAVYYVHSYYATGCEDTLIASSNYEGLAIPGIVKNKNVIGMQFHPEKSGKVGLQLLSNFAVGEEKYS